MSNALAIAAVTATLRNLLFTQVKLLDDTLQDLDVTYQLTSLAPGDDSPFVVSVPVTAAVARYRIGFRGEDGRVIAHVDKRQQGPVAANW